MLKFLIKLRLNFPELPAKQIEQRINKGKYFYLKRRLDQNDKEKLWSLGEKGIIFEPFQSRIYTHANLYSHVLGQVDYDNYGISGVEKYFDAKLKDKKLLKLSTDAFNFIKNDMYDGSTLYHSNCNMINKHEGMLEDYSYIIRAGISIFEITNDKQYLEFSITLSEILMNNFSDGDGMFFTSSQSQKDIIIRNKQIIDNLNNLKQ